MFAVFKINSILNQDRIYNYKRQILSYVPQEKNIVLLFLLL